MQPSLCLTVDVEEDMPGWEITDPIRVENVAALQRLAAKCDELGVRPTYLCTYPTVTNEGSTAILRELARRGDCELGTHLHPWNTPPFLGVPGRDGKEQTITYYQFELGPERFRAKLENLHRAVAEVAGKPPVSFRAGRFGIDAATMRELLPLGYEVDSSVTPLEEHMGDGGPDFRNAPQFPYRPHHDDVTRIGDLPIVEIPVSVGFTRNLPVLLQRAFVKAPAGLHLRGLLSRDFLRFLDFGWLYPARFEVEIMRSVADVLARLGAPVFNVFMHSSELAPGLSGRGQDDSEVEAAFARTCDILEHLIDDHGAIPATLSEAGRAFRPSLGL